MSRLHSLFDVLSTACESHATAVRIEPDESVQIIIDGHLGSLDEPRFDAEDVRALALFLRKQSGSTRRAVAGLEEEFTLNASGIGRFRVQLLGSGDAVAIVFQPQFKTDPELELSASAFN